MADYLNLRPEDLSAGATSLKLNSLMPVGSLTSGLTTTQPKIPTAPLPVPGLPINPYQPPVLNTTAPTSGPVPGLPSGFNLFGKAAGTPGATPTSPLGPALPAPAIQPPPVPAPAPAQTPQPTMVRAPMPAPMESSTPAPAPATTLVKAPAPMPVMESSSATPTPAPFANKTLNTKTGEATMNGLPMPAPTPTPTPADVATPMPSPFGQKTINTKTGDAFVDGNKVGTTAPAPAAPATPATPQPDPLAEFETMARNYMTGTLDEVFRVAANRAVDRLALLNNAERDAMQMRINQDPNLRGQGAGKAYLQIMARNQNFTEGEVFAQLAEDSRQRILDMQKWGFEAGLKVNEVRRTRAKENFSTLLATGQWDGAAAALQGIIDRDLPNSGIKVNASTFSSRDALTRSDFDSNLDTLATLAKTDRAAAVAQAAALIAKNPERFPPGMTAEQYVATLETQAKSDPTARADFEANLETIRTLARTDKTAATARVAALMASNPERFPPGMTPEQYVATLEEEAKRDAHSQSQFASQMQLIKDIAKVNPQAAAGMLATVMANPAYKGWFPEGATAEQLISSFSGSNTAGNITQANTIQTEINKIAAAGQNFNEVAGIYDDLFRLMGRNAVTEGKTLDLERINTMRTADGLGAFAKDAQGNLVDENGIPLTDEDFAELGYRADYYDKVTKAQEEPWVKARELIMKSPSAQKFLDESLFPGSKDALDSYLESYFLNPGNFVQDPATGVWTPDTTKLQLPWKSPEYYHVYFTWPWAVFNTDGTIKTDASGKPIFDMGGDVYGEMLGDQKVVATPEDQELDAAWVKYQRSGGKLTAPQWYFATAGGTRPPNDANIPKEAGGGTEDFTKVGEVPKTIQEERDQLIASLKPSQKPPEGGDYVLYAKSNGGWPSSLLNYMPPLTEWKRDTKVMYWDPDTAKYSTNKNDRYRALYEEV